MSQGADAVTAARLWWHRRVRKHEQLVVLSGVTEPGVRCYCPGLITCDCGTPATCERPYRWFPSDGGRGR